jgi:hypothetical protein
MLAILDDDVASAAIRMRIHFLAALWALDSMIHLAPVRLMGRFHLDFVARAQIVDNGDEVVHPDQHSAALVADPTKWAFSAESRHLFAGIRFERRTGAVGLNQPYLAMAVIIQ